MAGKFDGEFNLTVLRSLHLLSNKISVNINFPDTMQNSALKICALYKETDKENEFKFPITVSALSHVELKEVNSRVSKAMQSKSSAQGHEDHVNYKYTPDQRAMIGRYAAKNGPTCAANQRS